MKNLTTLINTTCAKYGITPEDLTGSSRVSVLVAARAELAQKLRKTGLSYGSIGFILKKKDHTTIINYLKKRRKKL